MDFPPFFSPCWIHPWEELGKYIQEGPAGISVLCFLGACWMLDVFFLRLLGENTREMARCARDREVSPVI